MTTEGNSSCTAFAGLRCLGAGDLREVARGAKVAIEGGEPDSVLIFDDSTGEQVDLDFRGTAEEVVGRIAGTERANVPPATTPDSLAAEHRGPGRPKLGVVAREVTLLPRHWEWLNGQPRGASVTLRMLVEQARRENESKDRRCRAQEAAYRVMSALAGNLPGFEEASRALFAGNSERFAEEVKPWPDDVRGYACRLAEGAFTSS